MNSTVEGASKHTAATTAAMIHSTLCGDQAVLANLLAMPFPDDVIVEVIGGVSVDLVSRFRRQTEELGRALEEIGTMQGTLYRQRDVIRDKKQITDALCAQNAKLVAELAEKDQQIHNQGVFLAALADDLRGLAEETADLEEEIGEMQIDAILAAEHPDVLVIDESSPLTTEAYARLKKVLRDNETQPVNTHIPVDYQPPQGDDIHQPIYRGLSLEQIVHTVLDRCATPGTAQHRMVKDVIARMNAGMPIAAPKPVPDALRNILN